MLALRIHILTGWTKQAMRKANGDCATSEMKRHSLQ
jgi:hypothetical protein